MVQLKLTLKSSRPSTVYSFNGKAYRLQPGSNTLNLEYDDYLALAKALSIKPISREAAEAQEKLAKEKENKQEVKEPESHEDNKALVEEVPDNKESETVEEHPDEESVSQEDVKEPETVEDVKDDAEENTSDEVNESVDYSTWSYTKLKSEYKAITGNACKLKKDEVIAFLQDHANNV